MGLGLCRSLAQGIQPCQRFVRQRSAQAGQERRADGQLRSSPVLRGFRQPQFHIDAGLDELPGGELGRPDIEEDECPGDGGPASDDVRRSPEILDLPPGAGRQATSVGLDSVDAGPPVAEMIRLGKEGPDVLAGCGQLPGSAIGRHVDESLLFRGQPRLKDSQAAYAIPIRSRSRSVSRPISRLSVGEATIATSMAARPVRAKVTKGIKPTRRETRRETPFASIRISPTFRRVTKVDDISARFRSRNSIRLKCVPTATISSAPFSKASNSATSSLIPGARTTW